VQAKLLDASAISHALHGGYWRVSTVSEAPSTQDLIRTSNPQHGDVIAAEFQSAGRGRMDRTFEAEKSTALLFSFYIEPTISREKWSFIPLLIGLTVAETLDKSCETDIYKTKWPNDIVVGDKKISGTIAEISGSGIIIGVGINITMAAEQLPVPTASSVLIESQVVLNRNELLAAFLTRFATNFEAWESGSEFITTYASQSATIAQKVRAIAPDGSEQLGTAISVDETGALHLDSGAIVHVGDVEHLR